MSCKGVDVCNINDEQPFRGVFRVEASSCNTSRIGRLYWKLCMHDYSGCIDAYYWDRADDAPKPGTVIWVSGQGRRFGSRQICDVISMIQLSTWEGCPLLLADPTVPFPNESEKTAMLLEQIDDIDLKGLAYKVLSDRQFMHEVLKAPGSLNHHHAYPGGLIRHTRETMQIVLAQAGGLKPIERDLLLVSAFLHDLGKAHEYSHRRRLTDRGSFLGHEVTLLEILAPIMNEFWDINHPTRIALLHFLVAKPAPQWTGIRHPRSGLINILRFADRLSGEMDMESRRGRSRLAALLQQANPLAVPNRQLG